MENKEFLKEQFLKYLNGESSSTEAEQLLRHIQSGEDKEFIEGLIAGHLDNPIAEELANSTDTQARLEMVHQNLRRQIRSKGKIVRMPVRGLSLVSIAASFTILLVMGWLMRNSIRSWLDPVKMEQLITSKGEHKEIRLADGSIIWIGPESKFQYPDKFEQITREVKLTGSAIFKVAKDKAHPFIVHTGIVSTKVLGTTFHIQAYEKQDAIEVTLVTGKVELSAGNKQVQLTPNQQGTFLKTKGTLKETAYPNAAKFLAERDGLYEYDGDPAVRVVFDLQRQFNIAVQLDAEVAERSFYGSFSVKDGAELALRKLCVTINAKYYVHQGTYIIVPLASQP
ncbi:FecR family protein [Mucilaginibacter sp.]